jgi:hypothetical protein
MEVLGCFVMEQVILDKNFGEGERLLCFCYILCCNIHVTWVITCRTQQVDGGAGLRCDGAGNLGQEFSARVSDRYISVTCLFFICYDLPQ